MGTYKIHYKRYDAARARYFYIKHACETAEADDPLAALKKFMSIHKGPGVYVEVIEGCGREAHKTYFVTNNSTIEEM
jgi:hypothetical protein